MSTLTERTWVRVLMQICTAPGAGALEDGLDMVYQDVDALMREGRFVAVNDILGLLRGHVADMPVVIALGVVSITQPASGFLLARPAFIAEVRELLSAREPGREAELLEGIL